MGVALVLVVSVALQFAAAMLALRLTWVTQAGRAWMLIAVAIFLMAVRRSITLLQLMSGDLAQPLDLAAELVALGTSILMVAGIAWIAPLFLSIRRHQKMLRQSEQRYRVLSERNPHGIQVIDPAGIITYVNPAYQEMLGYTKEELLGKSTVDLLEPASKRPELREYLSLLVKEQPEPTTYFQQNRRKDGEVIEQAVDWSYRRDGEGNVVGFISVITDITQRKRAEEATRRERDFAEGLIETARVIVLVLDNDGRIVRFNAYMEEISGYRLEEVRGKDWVTTFLPERDRSHMGALFQEAVSGARTRANVNPILTKDGREREIEWYDTTLKDAGGDTVGVLAVGQDVTERNRAEEALRESHEELQAIYDGMLDGLLVTDAETKEFLRVNSAICRMTGYSENELLTMSVMDLHAPEALPHVLEHFEAIVDGREFVAEGIPFRRKDGTVYYADVATRGSPVKYHRRPCLIALIHDITERKIAQEALRESEEFSSSLLNYSPHPVVVINRDTSIRYVNPALVKLTGFSLAELIGKQAPYPWWTEETLKETNEDLRKSMSSGANKLDELFRRKDGERFWVEITSTPVKRNGEFRYYLANWADVTERRRAKEQLQISLKEKELLLREIHHRVKNNMQVMTGLLRLQARRIKSKSALEAFEETRNRIKAMALVHETLYESEGLASFDMQRYVERVGKGLLLAYGRSNRSVDLLVDVRGVTIGVDAVVPVGLILNELISNCLKHAFPDKRPGKIRIGARPAGEDKIELSVSDDGVGMPQEIDPQDTETIGLGLVAGLAENQLGGSVQLARAGGTQFTITFKHQSNSKGDVTHGHERDGRRG